MDFLTIGAVIFVGVVIITLIGQIMGSSLKN